MSHSLLETIFKRVDRARFDSASPDEDCCGICLEPIVSDDRCSSMAKLQCGHEFHLKCVSLAFSAKNRMECPNCRNVESEEWELVAAAVQNIPRRRYRDISELMSDHSQNVELGEWELVATPVQNPRRRYRDISELMSDHTENNNSPILGLLDRTSDRPHSSHNPANFLPHITHADIR